MTTTPHAEPAPDSAESYIFRPWRRLPDGTILWAKNFGKKAWKIPVSANENKDQKAS